MPPNPNRAAPVATSWRWRGLVFVAVVLALIAVSRWSVATVTGAANPALALQLDPLQPEALATTAQRDLIDHPTAAAAKRVAGIATTALMSDPTNAGAAAALGFATELLGQRESARSLVDYAERLSRRQLATELWLIESTVERGDVAGALRHYDIALRTSKAAPAVLFPVLVNATDDPALIRPLAAVIARRPWWTAQYLQQLAQSGRNLPNIVALYTALRARGAPVSPDVVATLVGRLVDRQSFGLAWRFYTQEVGLAPALLRDGRFTATRPVPTAFDWSYPGEGGVNAEPELAETGMALHFTAPASAGGVAARQLLLLPAGAHPLSGRVSGIGQSPETAPYLRLRCAADGRELGRQALPVSADAPARLGMTLIVPSGCAAQWLELVLQPTDGIGGTDGYLDAVAIAR